MFDKNLKSKLLDDFKCVMIKLRTEFTTKLSPVISYHDQMNFEIYEQNNRRIINPFYDPVEII